MGLLEGIIFYGPSVDKRRGFFVFVAPVWHRCVWQPWMVVLANERSERVKE